MKVSVIVPVHNTSQYLHRCLRSLVSQTLQDIEILVFDDGSCDSSFTIMQEYAQQYENMHIFTQENVGIAKTRNRGMEVAKGEYIVFIDSDDYIDSHMLEEMYEKAKKETLDIVICNYQEVNEEGDILRSFDFANFETTSLFKRPQLLNEINYGPCNKMFERSLLMNSEIRYPEATKYEDFPFVMDCIIQSKHIGCVRKPFYYYVIHDNSETTLMDERVFDILPILAKVNQSLRGAFPLYEQLEYLNIDKVTTYCLQQVYQKDKASVKRFQEEAYAFLTSSYPNWKQNKIFKQQPFLKYIIKSKPWICSAYVTCRRVFVRCL